MINNSVIKIVPINMRPSWASPRRTGDAPSSVNSGSTWPANLNKELFVTYQVHASWLMNTHACAAFGVFGPPS